MDQSSTKRSGDASILKRPVAALETQTAASADDSPSVCELVSLRIDRLLGGSSASAPYPTLSQMHMEPPQPPKRDQREDDMDDSRDDRKRKANRSAKNHPSNKMEPPQKVTRLSTTPGFAVAGRTKQGKDQKPEPQKMRSDPVITTEAPQIVNTRRSSPRDHAIKEVHDSSNNSHSKIKKEQDQEQSLTVVTIRRKSPRLRKDVTAKAAVKQHTKVSSSSNVGIKKEKTQSLKVTAQRKTPRLRKDAPAKAAVKQGINASSVSSLRIKEEQEESVEVTLSTQQKEWKNKLRTREPKPKIEMVFSDEETEEERQERLERRRLKFWDDWEEGFRALLAFKKVHRHCDVPFQNGKLSKWVNSLRRQYSLQKKGEKTKAYALTPERIERLNKVGFAWGKWNESEWDECYEKLKAYKKIHKHTRVPRIHEIGRWAESQRQQYRKRQENLHHFLTDSRMAKLNKIGFQWTLVASWKESYDKLVEFKKEHGHLNVPQKQKPLGSWCRTQRYNYHVFKRGQKTKITSEYILALDKLGFPWVDPRSLKKGRKINKK